MNLRRPVATVGGIAFSIVHAARWVRIVATTLQTLGIKPKIDAKIPCNLRGLPIPISLRMTKPRLNPPTWISSRLAMLS